VLFCVGHDAFTADEHAGGLCQAAALRPAAVQPAGGGGSGRDAPGHGAPGGADDVGVGTPEAGHAGGLCSSSAAGRLFKPPPQQVST
jgi:hypothetical protein